MKHFLEILGCSELSPDYRYNQGSTIINNKSNLYFSFVFKDVMLFNICIVILWKHHITVLVITIIITKKKKFFKKSNFNKT